MTEYGEWMLEDGLPVALLELTEMQMDVEEFLWAYRNGILLDADTYRRFKRKGWLS